eukprot:TRINITY_DN8067_c5_g1_i1.p1 TRINITY_DN8067_c5_g1~~TRINITY_DN8067_c5_g1_i1.p1  ORF type:complete len:549 (+),score=72.07 TRINITY_DN8067_c5_g1_i1:103-1749(+)
MDYHSGGTRERWKSPTSFFLVSGLVCCGIATSMRFPWMVAKYGAGYLYLYMVSILFIGWPLIILELGLGQFRQQAARKAFSMMERRASGLGLGASWLTLVSVWCYSSLLAYTTIFTWYSTYTPLPWRSMSWEFAPTNVTSPGLPLLSSQLYFQDRISAEIDHHFSYQLVFCFVAIWFGVFLLSADGILVPNRIAAVTAAFYISTQLFIIGYCCIELPGSIKDGLVDLLVPKEAPGYEMAVDAVSQALFTCNIGLVVMVSFGSFNEEHRDIVKYSMAVILIVIVVSLLTSVSLFVILGWMANSDPRPHIKSAIDLVHSSDRLFGYELILVSYAALSSQFNGNTANVIAILCFFSFSLVCMVTLHAWCLALLGVLRDFFNNPKINKLAAFACFAALLGSLPFASGWVGYTMLTNTDLMLVRVGIPFAASCQAFVASWGGGHQGSDTAEIIGRIRILGKRQLSTVWLVLIPASSIICFVCSCAGVYMIATDTDSPAHTGVASFLIAVYPALLVVGYFATPPPPNTDEAWTNNELTMTTLNKTEKELVSIPT